MKKLIILSVSCIVIIIIAVIMKGKFTVDKNTLMNANIQRQLDVESHELSDEKVLEIYNHALKVFYWFQVGTMNSNYADSIVIDNQTYFEIVDEIGSYQELVDFMRSALDDKLVDQLLSTKVYINYDGKLFGLSGDRGTDQSKGEGEFEIIREDNQNIICRINVEILDTNGKVVDYEVHDFHLKYYDDHKWRFESFYLYK